MSIKNVEKFVIQSIYTHMNNVYLKYLRLLIKNKLLKINCNIYILFFSIFLNPVTTLNLNEIHYSCMYKFINVSKGISN